MSNGPFDRVLLNTREKVLSPDWNAEFSQQDRSILDTLAQLSTRRTSAANSFGLVSDGFVGDGFSVHATSPASLNVIVSAGLAFVANPYAVGARTDIGGVSGVNALSALVPVYLSGSQSFTVPTAPSAGNARIDIIEVRADHLVGGATSRQVLNPTTGAFVATSVNKLLSWDVFGRIGYVAAGGSSTEPLSYKQGTAATAGTEIEPSTTSGYVKIAAIRVAASVTTIEENKVLDYRPLYAPYGQMTVTAQCTVGYTSPNLTFNNGITNAPPGVEMTFTAPAGITTNYEGVFWLKMGDLSRWQVVGVSSQVTRSGGVVFPSPSWHMQLPGRSVFTMNTTANQTYLATGGSGHTTPGMQVAIGQQIFQIPWAFGVLQQQGATNIDFATSTTASGTASYLSPATIEVSVHLARIA